MPSGDQLQWEYEKQNKQVICSLESGGPQRRLGTEEGCQLDLVRQEHRTLTCRGGGGVLRAKKAGGTQCRENGSVEGKSGFGKTCSTSVHGGSRRPVTYGEWLKSSPRPGLAIQDQGNGKVWKEVN